MSATELARRLHVQANLTPRITQSRAITGDMALHLPRFLGTSAEFWLELQGLYELRAAQKKVGIHQGAPQLKHSERCARLDLR